MKGRLKLAVAFLAGRTSPLGTIHLLLGLWDAKSTGCSGLPGLGPLCKPGSVPLTPSSQLHAEQDSEFWGLRGKVLLAVGHWWGA